MYLGGSIQGDTYDYYETRTKGRYYLSPSHHYHTLGINTDSRKPLSFSMYLGGNKRFETDEYGFYANVGAELRIGQHLNLNLRSNVSDQINGHGFYTKNGNDILFSKRDVRTISNVFGASYVLNNKMSLNLRTRHYWSSSLSLDYELLQPDGSLIVIPTFSGHNKNYNAFTVDTYFRWVFAPGSELVFAWKNSGESFQNTVVEGYTDNLKKSLDNPMNSLSLKVLYYIDFNALKNRLKS